MLKETKNTMQERAFEEIHAMGGIKYKSDTVRVFLELMYSIINNEILDKEINLVYIGTFKLLKRNGKKSNAYYIKVIYSKKLREKIKKEETQAHIDEYYKKNYLRIIPFDELKKITLKSFELEEVSQEQIHTRSFVYDLLDNAYNTFKETFFEYLFSGHMIDMGNKILHIGENKKYGYVLSQKNKQAQLLAINQKIEVEILEKNK